jgi:toxin ParE1/3/4
MKLIISPNAYRDLLAVAEYIMSENPEAALSILDEIEIALNRLKDFPFMGVVRDSLRPGYRLIVVGNYNVLYKVENDRIYVVRILHHAQDVENAFER